MSELLELTETPEIAFRNIKRVCALIAEAFDSTSDLDKRESLLALHFVTMNAIERLVRPDLLDDFQTHRARFYWSLLASEAVDRDGLVISEKLEWVTAREVAAGRMAEDDKVRQLALQGVEANTKEREARFGKPHAPTRSGLWNRLFKRA